jgi:DNA-binding NarL/FixJ family response regulator
VLVVSQHLAERYALQLLGNDAQGVGYLLKDRIADLDDFLDAVRTVASGGTALDPEVVARMMGRQRRENPLERLTPRERDVLSLIVEGMSNHGIAERLHVGPHAVEKHVTSIFEKLELGHDRADHRRVLAVLKVLRAS